MWTAHHCDSYLHRIASQDPNDDPVLSGYFNRDAEGRDHFERRASQLRATLPSTQRLAWDEAITVARRILKHPAADTPALAFFVRGGQRMFVYQAPLALPTTNRLTHSTLPSLYPLCEVRDNLDRFSLLHIQPDATTLSHFELGNLHFHLSFRAPFRSTTWRLALVESMRQFAVRNASSPRADWIIAAPEDLLSQCQRLLRRRVELLPVDPAADPQVVRQLALNHFRDREEHQSRRIAHSLIERQRQGQPVHLGATPVLSALSTKPVETLVLHARSPKDIALRWIRKESDPFSFHDQAVWLARRNNTHVEIVNESEELSRAGGSACL